ncbi:hypothetical protein Pfo_001273 [Paulownia fortunei]|nr:hypothetical protein Pfo_001273 [Paulownia fortunei]
MYSDCSFPPIFKVGNKGIGLQIELLARVQREEIDGLFYTNIVRVKIKGHSLKPAFDIEMGTCGSVTLRHRPDVVKGVLDYISEVDEGSDEEQLDIIFENLPEDSVLWLHQVEDLLQLLMFTVQYNN